MVCDINKAFFAFCKNMDSSVTTPTEIDYLVNNFSSSLHITLDTVAPVKREPQMRSTLFSITLKNVA